MSYQPYNSIPVTPISMLDRNVPIFEEKEEEFVEGFSAPKMFKNERMPVRSMYQQDSQQPPSTPTPPPPPPPAPDSSREVLCELRNIKYLLAIIALLMFLLLLFRR